MKYNKGNNSKQGVQLNSQNANIAGTSSYEDNIENISESEPRQSTFITT